MQDNNEDISAPTDQGEHVCPKTLICIAQTCKQKTIFCPECKNKDHRQHGKYIISYQPWLEQMLKYWDNFKKENGLANDVLINLF